MTFRSAAVAALICAGLAARAAAQDADSTLARNAPDRTRDSIAVLTRAALRGGPVRRAAQTTALRLAAGYQRAWGDSFLLRRTRWVFRLGPRARLDFLAADSLRRLGGAQLFRDGPAAAEATWRRGHRRLVGIGDSVGANQLLGNIGAALYEADRLDSAAVNLERARRTAERLGDLRTAANALTILGNTAWRRGAARIALEHNTRAAALHQAVGDIAGTAADHNNAGLAAEALGSLDEAERHFRQALALESPDTSVRAADYLVNLGGLASRRGDTDEARVLLERALERYRAADESLNAALVERNLGTLHAGTGRYRTAEAHYRAALEDYGRNADARGEADVLQLLASLYEVMGRLDDALDAVIRAETLALRLDPPDRGLAAAVRVVRGDLDLALNLTGDAAADYAEAERLARAAGRAATVAAAAQGLAQLDLRASRYDQAIRRLTPIARAQPPGRERAWSRLLLGTAHDAAGDTALANRVLSAAAAEFDVAGDRVGGALALAALARADVRQGRLARSRQRFEDSRRLAAGVPGVEWWLQLEAGRALETAADAAGAAAQYDSAIATIESLGSLLRFDDRRSAFLDDKWDAYLARVDQLARQGDTRSSLAASERMRARHLLDVLARRHTPSARELALRTDEQRLRRRIGTLALQLTDAAAAHRGEAPRADQRAREELLAAEDAYRRLLNRIQAESAPAGGDWRMEPSEPERIREALRPTDLLLEYLVGEDRLWVFAVTDTGYAQFAVEVSREALRTQVDFARWAIEHRRDQPDLWRGALRGLDATLLGPVRRAGLLEDRPHVLVVPHRELHYLPFEALLDSTGGADRYLVEGHDVTYLSSASVWLRTRQRASSPSPRILALAPFDADLVGTRSEVEAIGATWGDRADVRRGSAASESVLHDLGDRYRIVHLATRGVLDRRNPLFSYVALSALGPDDGRLEVHEVLHLSFATDLLVLTACQTALGAGSVADVPDGDDWVGFVQAFLQAGAHRVLATLWTVDDRSTADLAATFHRRVAAGDGFAAALAAAKRDQIARRGRTPFDWAGLVLNGAP